MTLQDSLNYVAPILPAVVGVLSYQWRDKQQKWRRRISVALITVSVIVAWALVDFATIEKNAQLAQALRDETTQAARAERVDSQLQDINAHVAVADQMLQLLTKSSPDPKIRAQAEAIRTELKRGIVENLHTDATAAVEVNQGRQYSFLRLLLNFLDKHSGPISAVGLILAAIGVLLTLRYLTMYKGELQSQKVEQDRLEWERILKILLQVAKYAALANLSSVNHSPARVHGYLAPELADRYGFASENLLNYWLQLKVELDIMPDSPLVDTIQRFVAKYDASADSRASEEFATDLHPITQQVGKQAQKPPR